MEAGVDGPLGPWLRIFPANPAGGEENYPYALLLTFAPCVQDGT